MGNLSNIFVVGCGRNGTSMVAGLFAKNTFFMGDNLHLPRDSNPKGFFEDATINQLNDRILARHTAKQTYFNGITYLDDAPKFGQHWLARIPINTNIEATNEELTQVEELCNRSPFCYKDTRFCYTLHIWHRFVPDAKNICVFRAPNIAVESILKECHTQPYLADFAISVKHAFEVWYLMYSHVIERLAVNGDWIFIKYDDVLSGDAFPIIEKFTGVKIDHAFPESKYNRSVSSLMVPDHVISLYEDLCERTDS